MGMFSSDEQAEYQELTEQKNKYDNHIAKIKGTIARAYRYNEECIKHYHQLAAHCKAEGDEHAYHEFKGLLNGVGEANNNIRRFFEAAELTDIL